MARLYSSTRCGSIGSCPSVVEIVGASGSQQFEVRRSRLSWRRHDVAQVARRRWTCRRELRRNRVRCRRDGVQLCCVTSGGVRSQRLPRGDEPAARALQGARGPAAAERPVDRRASRLPRHRRVDLRRLPHLPRRADAGRTMRGSEVVASITQSGEWQAKHPGQPPTTPQGCRDADRARSRRVPAGDGASRRVLSGAGGAAAAGRAVDRRRAGFSRHRRVDLRRLSQRPARRPLERRGVGRGRREHRSSDEWKQKHPTPRPCASR